ncbi:DUF1127 domain-containing protein [Aliishimia ponticola]|uniref:DUF1127 domain-containing protein n=1 Tax=Aliishimia ponticola TaxID=2499833 RepID=A0A4S4ND22_9RHOB|nr:DUF1127 domain-containing protein [Aliishimia ponticola]THH35931.1 DUF1127 domain-containing protein [Aliishimia ponticola]
MADFTANHAPATTFGNPISRFFSSIWHGLIFLAEQNSRVKALNELAETTDAELASKGLTREQAARRITSDMLYI